ncbi:UTP--glucose-1-phosphate uridylyltransferase GalU [Shimazuella kribbensis]|uniref:UTP--glucose-1-phosphate uridylyltransferase GalU n=1 Tax=Shimazuella kribbensis TaxID=139808 RepID=UPI000416D4F9
MKIRKAVIPAAGLGTRFLPATKALPKEMLPIVDKPAIQYIVEEAVQAGIESIIIVTGRNKRSIEDHFDRSIELEQNLQDKGKSEVLQELHGITNMASIHYIRQKNPLGLGHAILCAEHFIDDEPFAVLLGDDIMVSKKPALQQIMNVYETYQNPVIGVKTVQPADVNKYGIIDAYLQNGSVYQVRDLVEKPSIEAVPSQIAIMGRYILEPSIFPILQTIERGAGNEIQLTDALRVLLENVPIHALELEGDRYDIGDKLGYLQASTEMGLRRKEMREPLLAYLQNVLEKELKRSVY